MSKYIHARTCVYNLNYHIVWCVKYRRKVLDEEISSRLYGIIQEIAQEKGFHVATCKVGDMDHVHCFLSLPPKMSVTQAVKYLKGISGNRLFTEFPFLRERLWKGQLWNGSYFAESIGSTSEENVLRYIERQKNCQRQWQCQGGYLMGKKFAGQMDTEKAEAVEQRAYRFEGFPSQEQAHLLSQFIGSARFLWNRMLADWKGSYKETGKSAPVRTPASYKEDPALAWLKGMDSLALANVQQNFQRAVKEFFSGEKGCPRFKKKHACPDTYTTNLSNRDKPNLRLSGCLLKLPKIKGPVRLRVHRKVREGGLLKNCTVTREPDGRWYFSLLFEYPKQELPKKAAGKGPGSWEAIGLDMSLPELYVDSDGNTPAYPKPYRKLERKIAREQRKLSRMEKDSRNYTKQLKKIAKLHAKAKHQRADFLHKLSYRLVTHYDIICIEDLSMSAIKKALSFGKSASDNGWGMFVRMLTYKAEWYGSTVIKVGKFFPSSKTCCACGHVHKELKLSDRVYVCPACGHVMGRDHQAAVNIREEGVRIYISTHPLTA